MVKNRILVIGSGGQLGICINDELNIFLSKPDVSSERYKYNWMFASSADLDIRNTEAIDKELSCKQYKYVINCAAITDVPKIENEKECWQQAIDINGIGCKNLIDACNKYGVKLIHISTDYVYPSSNDIIDETHTTSPLNKYGQSKLLGDNYIIERGQNNYMILRISTLYSKYGNNLIKKLLYLFSQIDNGTIDAINDNSFSTTNANHLAKFIVRNIIYDDEFHPGIYHYGDNGYVSTYDIANYIKEVFYNDCSVNPISINNFVSPVVRPQYCRMSFDKLKNTYGIELDDWGDSIREVIMEIFIDVLEICH